MSDPTASGNPLDRIIADYLQAAEAGKVPSREALLDAHPEFADDLRAFFADYDRLDNRAEALKLGTPRPPAERPRVRYFGDYELLEEIAEGGMGLVYKARQESLGRVVALKLVRAGRLAKPIDIARFRIEAEAAAGLDHPNIVPLYEVGEHEGQHYLAMKFIDGPPLAKLPRGVVRTEVATMVKVARAVHHAHQQGIIHRDIKPSNILTDSAGTPYVTDFGLAKRIDAELSLTESGQMLGTAGYIAPEQAQGKKGLTVTADVFSLGAVLFERLTGTPAFPGGTILERLRSLHDPETQLPRGAHRGLDRDLETICSKCLEREPDKRYPSAESLADDLDCWLRGEPIRARPMGISERVIRWARRRRTLVIGVASAAAAALLMAIVLQRPVVVQAPPVISRDGEVSAPDWLVRAETKDGPLTGSCWRTPEPDVLATSMAAIGMSSADAPRPTRVEVVWKAGRRGERVFPVTIAKLDDSAQTAMLRVRTDDIPQPRARPASFGQAMIAQAKKSVALVTAARGEEASLGSGFFAQPGLVVTSTDVLAMLDPMSAPPDDIKVTADAGTPNERVFKGNLVAIDRNEGLAVIRVAGRDLPTPLPLAPTANMQEAVKVLALGYPILRDPKVSSGLQAAIKARPTVLAGRIFTKQGSVKYLQLEGGPAPGSTVIDTNGDVVGVVLAGTSLTNMRFAVPSEYVTQLLAGRVLELNPGQAVQSANSIRQPIALTVADPLARIAGISLECWTSPPPKGDANHTSAVVRPAMDRQPIPRVGDGPVVKERTTYGSESRAESVDGQTATAELRLPSLKANEVYWIRPVYHFTNGRELWGEATMVEMGRNPVELRPAKLAVRFEPGTTRRFVLDTRKVIELQVQAGVDGLLGGSSETALHASLNQEIRAVRPDGRADIRVRFSDLTIQDADVGSALNAQLGMPLGVAAKRMAVDAVATKDGKLDRAKIDLSELPDRGRTALLENLNAEVVRGLQALSWAMPNKVVHPGDSWAGEVGFQLSVGRNDPPSDVRLSTTCKYLGRRLRNGRPEGVISMTGDLAGPKADYGAIRGGAAIDLESGHVTLGTAEANLTTRVRVPGISAGGNAAATAVAIVYLQQTLRQIVAPDDANTDPQRALPNQRITLAPLVGVGAPSPSAD